MGVGGRWMLTISKKQAWRDGGSRVSVEMLWDGFYYLSIERQPEVATRTSHSVRKKSGLAKAIRELDEKWRSTF